VLRPFQQLLKLPDVEPASTLQLHHVGAFFPNNNDAADLLPALSGCAFFCIGQHTHDQKLHILPVITTNRYYTLVPSLFLQESMESMEATTQQLVAVGIYTTGTSQNDRLSVG
jgi:hypothetical protein